MLPVIGYTASPLAQLVSHLPEKGSLLSFWGNGKNAVADLLIY